MGRVDYLDAQGSAGGVCYVQYEGGDVESGE